MGDYKMTWPTPTSPEAILNPQLANIALEFKGDMSTFKERYDKLAELFNLAEEALPIEPDAEPEEKEAIPSALVRKFFAEYRNGNDPDFGLGTDKLFATFLDMADIYEEGRLLRTQEDYDDLIRRWRIVSKAVAFLEKEKIGSIIAGLEKAERAIIKNVGNAGYDASYGVTAAIDLLKRLA